MSDPSLELQAAIVGKLKNDSGVQAIVGTRVYDDVPNNPTFPYIQIGDNQVLPDKADCIDGTEIFWQLDGWSRKHDSGPPEIKQISKAVIAAMDEQELILTGYTAVWTEFTTVNYLHDPDGITRHVAINFRFLIQAA